MQTCERLESEQLWLVRYLYASDLAGLPEGEDAPLGHAVLRACDGVQACQKLAAWLRLVLDEGARITSVDLLPPDALSADPKP